MSRTVEWMPVLLFERDLRIPRPRTSESLLVHIYRELDLILPADQIPVRFAVTSTTKSDMQCEIGVMKDEAQSSCPGMKSIFEFAERPVESRRAFNIAFLVPTGIGAEIGGHAGDASPAAQLIAGVCDTLITHPNVVNASDINEIPENGLYVEGSVVCRLLMGTAGLQPIRSNRVLVVVDAHNDHLFVDAAVNTVNAARAGYGLRCPGIYKLDPPIRMSAEYASSGRAAGVVDGLESLCKLLEEKRDEYDAVALSSVIDVPYEYHTEYFEKAGEMVNPWGGVEAILTHTISSLFDVPSAHSPMFESQEIANIDPGQVDPRMAAEAISLTFLQCVLKGLHRSPRIVTDPVAMAHPGVLTAADVSCMVIPDGCLGIPTLAALEQGIPVIAVRENINLMRNDLSALPWAPGQFFAVENYWEAVGVVTAIREGVSPESVRRPFASAPVFLHSASASSSAESEEADPSEPLAVETFRAGDAEGR